MFKLDNLQVKTCDEFIIDPLSCILQEQKLSNIGGAARIKKTQIIKAITKHFLEKPLHDMLKIQAFTTSAVMLIYIFTNSLIGLSIDQMLIPKIKYWLNNYLFHY